MDGVGSNEQKASSDEEMDLSEQNEEEVAPTQARTYDCIYCKRGFTTAQALGGHMNIHRKDRGKTSRRNREPPAIEKTEDVYSGRSYGYYPSYPNFQAYQPPSYTEYPSYSMYMPTSSSDVQSTRSSYVGTGSSHFGNDLQLGLGFHADTSHLEDEEEKEIDMDDGPDLELRLGYTTHKDD